MFCRIAIYALLLWFFLQGWKIAFSAQHQGVDSFDCLHHIVVILNLKQTHLKFPTKVLRRSAKYFSSLLKHTWRRRQGWTHRLVNLLITGWPRIARVIQYQVSHTQSIGHPHGHPTPNLYSLNVRSTHVFINHTFMHPRTPSSSDWLRHDTHSRPINQPTNQPTNQQASQPISKPTNPSNKE